MRTILYEDNNNNSKFLIKLLIEIQSFSNKELIWNISNIDLVSDSTNDMINNTLDYNIKRIYELNNLVQREHSVLIKNNELIDILKCSRNLYHGELNTDLGFKEGRLFMKIFDGDIIEISSQIEEQLNIPDKGKA